MLLFCCWKLDEYLFPPSDSHTTKTQNLLNIFIVVLEHFFLNTCVLVGKNKDHILKNQLRQHS